MTFESLPPKIGGHENVGQPLQENVESKTQHKTSKAAEVSKTALEGLKRDDTQLNKPLKANKHELNRNGGEANGTQEKAHEIGTETIVPGIKATNDKDLTPIEDEDLTTELSSDEDEMGLTMEDMSDEELAALLADDEEELDDLEANDSEEDAIVSDIKEQKKQVDEEISENKEIDTKIDKSIETVETKEIEETTTVKELANQLFTFVNGGFQQISAQLKPGDDIGAKLDELGKTKNLARIKEGFLEVHESFKAQIVAKGYADIPDSNGNMVRYPLNKIKFLNNEEFEQFIKDIRQHIETLQKAAIATPEEVEPEPEEEKVEGEAQKQPQQQAAVGQQDKPEADKDVKERRPFAKAEGAGEKSGPSVNEMNRRRLEDFENYMNLKMEKIRKQLKQEELTQEQVKRDELKTAIKATDADRHETHVEIANTDAAYKEMQRELKSLSETTFTVPVRKVFKELQVIFDKINTLNPGQKTTVALKKEVLDVAKELVKMSKEMKSVSEGSDRASGGGAA